MRQYYGSRMSYNFHEIKRDEPYLLPPSMAEWLPENHLAWFILDSVDQFDLKEFLVKYRCDGTGNTAFHPRMMLALLIYSYCQGVLSSRKIEILCVENVAYRVIASEYKPDHSTIARFRKDNLEAFRSVFTDVLRLCAKAGLVKVGKVAVDGTKIKANASMDANRTRETIEKEVAELLAQAHETDAQENAKFGDKRGDELPKGFDQRGAERLARLSACQMKIAAEDAAAKEEAKKSQEERAKKEAEAAEKGQKVRGKKPQPKAEEPEEPKANTTDPESQMLKEKQGFVQGYNMQAVVCDGGIVVAAEIADSANDQGQFEPMIKAARKELDQAGITDEIGLGLGDAGYCNPTSLTAELPLRDRLLATRNGRKLAKASQLETPESAEASPREKMDRRLRTEEGKSLYKRRGALVENRFGVAKEVHRLRRVSGRGKAFAMGEWAFVCLVMNLRRMWLLDCAAKATQ